MASGSNVGLNNNQLDMMKGMMPNIRFNNSPITQPMNMIGVGLNPMGNVGQPAWQMNPMAMAQGMPMQAQPGFGFQFDGGQAMMEMNNAMNMGMNPGFGFGFGYEGGGPNVGYGQGDSGLWATDMNNNQMQFLDSGLWDGSGNNGLNMNQWGFRGPGGYQQ